PARLLVVIGAFLLAAPACGSSSDGQGDGGPDAAAGDGPSGGGDTGASADRDGAGGGADAATGAKGAGGVFMSSYVLAMPGGPMIGNIAAAFTAAGTPEPGLSCTDTQEGVCVVRRCTGLAAAADAGTAADVPRKSAGVITISGGKKPITL